MEVCRLEGGFVVAGWDFATELDLDLSFKRSPFEVGLGWMVDLKSQNFIGKAALETKQKNGQSWAIRTIQVETNLDLVSGCELFTRINDEKVSIGTVSCSAWSWGLEKLIGNASISSNYKELAEAILVTNGVEYRVILGRGPHLDLVRRCQAPAEIEKVL